MSHLFESIRLINGQVRNLKYHQQRVERAFEFYGERCHLDLKEYFKQVEMPKDGLYKLRISYNINHHKKEHAISPYKRRSIKTLKLVGLTKETYAHKFEDREFIGTYYAGKGERDDVLFHRRGKVLDTSYCNVVFYDGKDWLTPKESLLRGTMRDRLLDQGVIREGDIFVSEMGNYKKVRLINAMVLWSDKHDILIKNIF